MKTLDKPTVQLIRQQIEATGNPLDYLSKVKTAIAPINSAIAAELDELILSQKVLK